jgi:hypothetical protein
MCHFVSLSGVLRGRRELLLLVEGWPSGAEAPSNLPVNVRPEGLTYRSCGARLFGFVVLGFGVLGCGVLGGRMLGRRLFHGSVLGCDVIHRGLFRGVVLGRVVLGGLVVAEVADEDLFDLDFDEALAVPLELLVLLLALVVEDEELVATAFGDNLGYDLGAGEVGLELALIEGDGDDFGELDGAVVVLGLLDADGVAGGDAVLFTTGFDDCVHSFGTSRQGVECHTLRLYFCAKCLVRACPPGAETQ